MTVLLTIFAIIGSIFFVFLVGLLGFYISISYEKDITGKFTDEEIRQIHKFLSEK